MWMTGHGSAPLVLILVTQSTHALPAPPDSIQRYVVRILFVAPVYALGSVLSLRFPNARWVIKWLD